MRVEATAPGKVILFGEHAVVYGRPAIAVPLTQVRARAVVEPNSAEAVRLIAPDLALDILLSDAPDDDPLAATVRQVAQAARLSELPGLILTVTSQIPIASGLGSGAAISAAIVRALAAYLGLAELSSDERVSALTYEVEKIHHGTPSGIDNTVVSFERPVYFVRRQPQNLVAAFLVASPLRLLVADTGVGSATKSVVGDVRRRWLAEPARFEAMFDRCGGIAKAARAAIEQGDVLKVGELMSANHAVLQEMTVSSPELDRLVGAAVDAGALGAKMSGAGRGGNMVALVPLEAEEAVRTALSANGAHTVLTTILSA